MAALVVYSIIIYLKFCKSRNGVRFGANVDLGIVSAAVEIYVIISENLAEGEHVNEK